MKKVFLTLFVAGAALISHAQVLPKPSPLAEVEQMVGVNEIELEYSRPSANGRTIFGGLVPYDQLWRFGANASTRLETDGEMTFKEGVLETGKYAIFAIPKEDGVWDIIFNLDSKNAGVSGYDANEDVLRVKGNAIDNSFTETFTLFFDKLTHKSASLVMLWENTRVDIPFTVNSEELAKQNIKDAIEKGEDLDKVYNNAAGYYFNILGNYEKTLKYADKSIEIQENHANIFTKARALDKLGKTEEAIELAKKALIMAEAAGSKGYAQFIAGTLEVWTK